MEEVMRAQRQRRTEKQKEEEIMKTRNQMDKERKMSEREREIKGRKCWGEAETVCTGEMEMRGEGG